MKRMLLTLMALASLAFAGSAPARAATSVDVAVRVGDPYRGASLRFRSEPDVVRIPRTRVYTVRGYDHDLYRYEGFWYFVEDGRWYRARSYRGPFIRIRAASVPDAVYYVPAQYRSHRGGPPAHAPAYGYYKNHPDQARDRNRDDNREWNRDRDRNRDRDWDDDRDGNRDRDRSGNRDRDGDWDRDDR